MKKKLLATAIAGAMVVPSAFAAQDTSGMQYTSASEGFYASIRVRLHSGKSDGADAAIENSTSRIGVRGSNDLGGGLEGFYRYEFLVPIANGDEGLSTRLSYVGLRGGFGQVWVGTNWAQSYNWVSGTTDIANVHSGNLNYTTLNPGRQSQAIEYTTPDLNGFQASGLVSMTNDGDGNDADLYIVGARYGIAGFDVAATYANRAEGIGTLQGGLVTGFDAALDAAVAANVPGVTSAGTVSATDAGNNDDLEGYSFKVGYAQDNWYVNAWYSQDNLSEVKIDLDIDGSAGSEEEITVSADDNEIFSIAAGVEVGKVNIYAVYENLEYGLSGGGVSVGGDDTYTTLGVQYNLGSRSRVWLEYAGQDLDSNDAADDYVNVGLRHDF